jgi:hypothetical protein
MARQGGGAPCLPHLRDRARRSAIKIPPWQARARGLHLHQNSIAAVLGRAEKWVTREIRTDVPHISIRIIIEFWELLEGNGAGAALPSLSRREPRSCCPCSSVRVGASIFGVARRAMPKLGQGRRIAFRRRSLCDASRRAAAAAATSRWPQKYSGNYALL